MLDFHNVSREDFLPMTKLFKEDNTRQNGMTFYCCFLWNHVWNQKVAYIGNRMILSLEVEGEEYFGYPIGTGDIEAAFEEIKSYCSKNNRPLQIINISEEQKNEMEELFPGEYSFEDGRDYYDYVLPVKDAFLESGRHYRIIRHSCKSLLEKHSCRVEQLSSSSMKPCKEFLDLWMEQNNERLDPSISEEYISLQKLFDLWEEEWDNWGLFGILLYVDEKVEGFSIYCQLTDDCADSLYQKGNHSIPGVYDYMNNEINKYLLENSPKTKYLNIEQDLGIPYLRKKKTREDIAFLIKCYLAKTV